MLIMNRARSVLKESMLTSETHYIERRTLLKKLGLGILSMPLIPSTQAGLFDIFSDDDDADADAFDNSGPIFHRDSLA
jgi:sulfoxide reductase catalytic subunit YedY